MIRAEICFWTFTYRTIVFHPITSLFNYNNVVTYSPEGHNPEYPTLNFSASL